MKLNWTIVVLLALLAATKTAARRKNFNASALITSLLRLNRGPPKLPTPRKLIDVETKWITQKLDHFDDKNSNTWEMRYMVNEEYLKNGGPIFIYLGGEWSISSESIKTGILPDLAREHEGILFYTEHRYYGESKPTSDLSLENLQKYLHVKQALADVAHFIRYQRENDARLSNSKVIICGGSYSATMVVWFSKLYPELVNGGWASSGSLLAKVDFKEYKEVTGKALRELGSEQCYNRVKNGIAELGALFESKRSAEAKALLKLCGNFDSSNELDLWGLSSTISMQFATLVQYQKEGDIPNFCNNLMSSPDDLTAISSFFLELIRNEDQCVLTTYQSYVDSYLDNPDCTEVRAWFFQNCNEFGWFQTSTSKEQPFGTKEPVTFYTKLCYDVFGSQYTPDHIEHLVAETNKNFGGLNPQVKNVYSTHGAFDPWSAIGHNETHGATVMPRTSHCADFGSIGNSDSDEMRASKLRLVELVKKWLA